MSQLLMTARIRVHFWIIGAYEFSSMLAIAIKSQNIITKKRLLQNPIRALSGANVRHAQRYRGLF